MIARTESADQAMMKERRKSDSSICHPPVMTSMSDSTSDSSRGKNKISPQDSSSPTNFNHILPMASLFSSRNFLKVRSICSSSKSDSSALASESGLDGINGDSDNKKSGSELRFSPDCGSEEISPIDPRIVLRCLSSSMEDDCIDQPTTNGHRLTRQSHISCSSSDKTKSNQNGSEASIRIVVPNKNETTKRNLSLTRFQAIASKVRWAKRWIMGEDVSDGCPDSFLEKLDKNHVEMNWKKSQDSDYRFFCGGRFKSTLVVDPGLSFYYYWLICVSLAVMYNSLIIIARTVFWKLSNYCPWTWILVDCFCDLIYILDIIVLARTGYLDQGLMVRDTQKLWIHYCNSWNMKLDVLSILPTDLFYTFTGIVCKEESMPCPVILRFNRLFKLYRLSELFERTETRTTFPNLFRILKLIFLIACVIHWNGCFYFLVSYMIGFGSDRFVYNNTNHSSLSHQYIYSMYWSTMTLSAIGDAADPVEEVEYLFTVVDFLLGILIFATIVGNVGSMISNMNAERVEFQHKMDSVKKYMIARKISNDIEDRVIKWFDYLWTEKQSLDEESVTSILPDRLKAEIAIHVHLSTLQKVKLFADCESSLLQELVLKLRLQVFSPGDYVCKKGDVGKEMYIVKRGRLNVVADDGVTAFASLVDGAVFGELSVLNIQGNKTGNRRTANVRSVGYSDLFVLLKNDLWDVLKDYPDAREKLIERGTAILRKDNLIDEEALLKSKREHETLITRSEQLTQGLEKLNDHFRQLLIEFGETQMKLKKRIIRLEDAISGLSPWQSTSTSAFDRRTPSIPSAVTTPPYDGTTTGPGSESKLEQNRTLPYSRGSVGSRNSQQSPLDPTSDQQNRSFSFRIKGPASNQSDRSS